MYRYAVGSSGHPSLPALSYTSIINFFTIAVATRSYLPEETLSPPQVYELPHRFPFPLETHTLRTKPLCPWHGAYPTIRRLPVVQNIISPRPPNPAGTI